MSKELPIIREVSPSTGEEYFPQTHVDAVIGLEEMIEDSMKEDIILRANNGKTFKLIVDEKGKLSTEETGDDN